MDASGVDRLDLTELTFDHTGMDVTVGTDRQGVPTHAFTQEGPEARREWTVTEMRGRREVWLVRLRGKNGAPDVTAMLVCDPATRRWRMVRSLTVVA